MTMRIPSTLGAAVVDPQDIGEWFLAAARRYPYLGRGFAAMRPTQRIVDAGGGPTVAVDTSWRLYWSPEALTRLSDEGCHPAEVIRHELEHLLREHADRRGHRNPRGWNIAGDAEINDDLNDADLPNAVYPEALGAEQGLTAEEYYQAGECCGGGGVGGDGGCGSGAGQPVDGELPDDGHDDKLGDIRTAVADDIQSAAASGRGTVPKGLLLWADTVIDRQRVRVHLPRLARALASGLTRGREDYSYAVMSRRQAPGPGLILPSTVTVARRLAVVADTSGSMGADASWVAGCLDAISRRVPRAMLYACDAAAYAPRRLRGWRDIRHLQGGGGTDMRVGIERALQDCPAVLVLSDGETPWPSPWPRGLVAMITDGSVLRG